MSRNNKKLPDHLDFIYVKPWKECKWGLARVFTRLHEGKTLVVAEGITFDENGRPFSFEVDLENTIFKPVEVKG